MATLERKQIITYTLILTEEEAFRLKEFIENSHAVSEERFTEIDQEIYKALLPLK